MSPAPDPDSLRIGTTEREDAVRVLGEHFAEGRLSTDEYESRVTEAWSAQTRADLRPLFEDLPAPRPAFLVPPTYHSPPYAPPMATPPSPSPPGIYSDKTKMTAGILQVVLPFGTGRLYTGHVGMAIAQFAVVLCTLGIGALWPFIDGILLLVNGGHDSYGRRLRD